MAVICVCVCIHTQLLPTFMCTLHISNCDIHTRMHTLFCSLFLKPLKHILFPYYLYGMF